MKAKMLKGMFASAVVATAMLSGAAIATPFSITQATVTPGSGYGLDSGPTQRLDVVFSTASFVQQQFNLTTVGQFATFDFGTANFRETGMISQSETNNLGVSASFLFAAPGNVTQVINATGTASTGPVNDNLVDFSINWADRDIAFGTTGLYRLSINDLSWRDTGFQNLTATVRLLRADTTTAVPEPSSLALTGLALAAFGVASRRRAKR